MVFQNFLKHLNTLILLLCYGQRFINKLLNFLFYIGFSLLYNFFLHMIQMLIKTINAAEDFVRNAIFLYFLIFMFFTNERVSFNCLFGHVQNLMLLILYAKTLILYIKIDLIFWIADGAGMNEIISLIFLHVLDC